MASFTLGTPSTIAPYASACSKIVKVNTNTYACLWIRDSDDAAVLHTYSFSGGVWLYGAGSLPLYTGDSWYSTAAPLSLCKIDTDRSVFAFCDGASYPRIRLVDTSIGAVMDRGSTEMIGAAGLWPTLAQIDTDKFVMVYRLTSDSKMYAIIGTVVGNTIVPAPGGSVELCATTSSSISVEKIATNKFAVFYNNSTDSTADVIICNVSGTVPAPGSKVSISGETSAGYCNIIPMDTDKFALSWNGASGTGKCVSVKVSGTVPDIGTVKEFNSSAISNVYGSPLSTTEFVLPYCKASTTGNIVRCAIDWDTNTILTAADYEWESSAVGGGTDRSLGSCSVDTNIIGVIYQDQGNSDYCKLLSIEAGLAAPLNVAASDTPKQGDVTITWDAVVGATSYNIYWRTTTGVTKANGTKIEGVTSPYVHEGLDLDQEYFYVVTAHDGISESDDSSEVSSYPLDSGSVLSAGGGDSSINLTWGDVAGATQYDLYYSTESGVTKITGTKIENVTSVYEHLGVLCQYYYYICIVSVGATEYTSNEAYATPQFAGKIFTHNEDMLSRLLYQYQKD